MAENDTPQSDKTERPSPKRLQDARRRGQLPRSRELSMTLVMLTAAGVFLAASGHIGAGMQRLTASGLSWPHAASLEPAALPAALGESIAAVLQLLSPLFAAALVAALAGGAALGGLRVSFEALAPKLERLSPVAGLKRIIGWSGIAELAKALAKFLLVAGAAVLLLSWLAADVLGLGRLHVDAGVAHALRILLWSLAALSSVLILIAGADVPFQLWQHTRRLRMTKQEVKDEHKETEGRPEVRAKIRALQQAVAQRRMMQDVPQADFVAVNPTHYAVALRYDAATMKAPRIVARGADLVALQIRAVAVANRVPLYEHPPLAQALYHTGRIGQEVAPALYVAVAQVLTYVYQLRGRAAVPGGGRPSRPSIAIDDALTMPPARRPRRDAAHAPGAER